MAFRHATAADTEAIVELVESAFRGPTSRLGWTTEADLLEGQRTDGEEVALAIGSADSVFLLATSNSAIAACCRLTRDPPLGAHLGMLAVAPELQHAGIGSALLERAERSARRLWPVTVLELFVIRQRSELIAWYLRRGYELTGRTAPFPYGDPRYGVPLRSDLEFAVMRKTLP